MQRLLIVSNRLPIKVSRADDGKWDITPSSGGLVTALSGVHVESRFVWIGWPGTTKIMNT
jgi:trehalose 6-phosphate synthase